MRILLAEDDPVSARALRLWLKQEGHEVQEAASGEAAWDCFRESPAELVLSDWQMPGMDGLELCRKIREVGGRDYAYFILMTAVYLGRESFRQSMEAGVDDYLTKPLDRELLAMRLVVAGRIQKANRRIRTLEELLPICMYCKRVREDGNYKRQLESYIHERTGSRFSHGVCPECYAREHGESGRD
jgi:sigma-B regulation protein RsbU (phosphoserine phosphatase)